MPTSSWRSRSVRRRAAGAGKVTQLLQLAVGGITFSLLLALAALGLSLIFGTTGLTNFAHGELVTFGAIAALAVDRLPGNITIGGTNITVITAVVSAFVVSGCSAGCRTRACGARCAGAAPAWSR